MNVHLLLHLVDNVKLFGPLWTHSCFEFESSNFRLRNAVHDVFLKSRWSTILCFVVQMCLNVKTMMIYRYLHGGRSNILELISAMKAGTFKSLSVLLEGTHTISVCIYIMINVLHDVIGSQSKLIIN